MPALLLASDFESYWTKFQNDRTSHVDLAFELLAKQLGNVFRIPIPDYALIRLDENSFEARDYPLLQAGLIGFGSKEIERNDPLSLQTGLVHNKHDYKKIANPEDFFRIAIFDLHLGNMDRMEPNFNILFDRANGNRLIAIDHIEIFRGQAHRQDFKPTKEAHIGASILRSSFGTSIMKFIGRTGAKAILDDYFSRIEGMQTAFEQFKAALPAEWGISETLLESCHDFLFDADRNASVEDVFRDYLRYLRT